MFVCVCVFSCHLLIVIHIMTVYRYIDCHNITYTTQSEVVDYNTSLSLQTPAVDFTVENETVSMLQYAVTCIYVTAYLLF